MIKNDDTGALVILLHWDCCHCRNEIRHESQFQFYHFGFHYLREKLFHQFHFSLFRNFISIFDFCFFFGVTVSPMFYLCPSVQIFF